jgi:glycosyltransferase involved in cell wall biosynthesis
MNLKSKVMPIFEVIRQIDMDLCNSLNLYWFVCGKGYYFEQLSQVVKERGLERNIIIHKHTEDVKSLYFWADIMIHLTRMDAFPNCTMEAMMHGVPVITNPDSCGTIELVQDGVNGLIGEDILALIERYKLDGSMIKLHGLNGKQIVETQFSVEAQKNIMKSVLMRW